MLPVARPERLAAASRSGREKKEVLGSACNGTVETVPFRLS
ncbi:MAG: hypothetical protein ACRD3T_00835 [Terriglobia bacterium]